MDEIVLAYLAGVLDSDGTIGIKRNTYGVRVVGDSRQPTYSERIHIRQVDIEAIQLFSDTFGGNIGITDPYAKRGKTLWNWGQTDLKATTTLVYLLPFLRIKKRQAENCLALRELKEQSKKARVSLGRGHRGSSSRPKELGDAMESLFLKAKELNKVGI